MVVSTKSADFGAAEVKLAALPDAQNAAPFGLNNEYLEDALNALGDAETVALVSNGVPDSPIYFLAPGYREVVPIVMPMQL